MTEGPRVLYLEGDPCALKFLEGAFGQAGLAWDRPEPPDAQDLRRADVVHFSDLPAKKLDPDLQQAVVQAVSEGTGLLMTGGWNSFGRGGYATGPLAQALPVRLQDGDDRRANVQGMLWRARGGHPILEGLDLRRPPMLCGHNRVEAKEGAHVVLEAAAVQGDPDGLVTQPDGDLLVVGHHGKGRVVAYASDLAPHWSGGLTDWGDRMLEAPEGEEVGDHYVRFVGNLMRWAAGR